MSVDSDVTQFNDRLTKLNETLNDFWLQNELFIGKLNQLKAKVVKLKRDQNIAKSVGNGVSAVGAIALGASLMPVTGGMSGLVAVGGGLASAAGAITTLGTDFADNIISKRLCSQLRQLAEDRGPIGTTAESGIPRLRPQPDGSSGGRVQYRIRQKPFH